MSIILIHTKKKVENTSKNNYDNREISKKFICLLGVVLLLLLAGFAIQYTKNVKTLGSEKKEVLLTEYQLLQPLPGAILKKMTAGNKDNQALVSATYSSNKNYNEIRTFYMNEASKRGWTFVNEKNVWTMGGEIGGRIIYFTKGDNALTIQYAGENSNYGWDFGVDISWRLLKNEK